MAVLVGACLWLMNLSIKNYIENQKEELKREEFLVPDPGSEYQIDPAKNRERDYNKKELPEEAKNLLTEIMKKDSQLQEIQTRMRQALIVDHKSSSKIQMLYGRAFDAGRKDGVKAFFENKISEKELLQQLNKALRLMDEAINEAKEMEKNGQTTPTLRVVFY